MYVIHVLDSENGDFLGSVTLDSERWAYLDLVEGTNAHRRFANESGDEFWLELEDWASSELGVTHDAIYFTNEHESEIYW